MREPDRTQWLSSPRVRLVLLLCLVLVAVVLYLTWDAKAGWEFTLSFRGTKLITLVLVGTSTSMATLLFQTATQNRILTPGIMGFDWLYALIQALLLLLLGVVGFSSMNPYLKWFLEMSLLVGSLLLLYRLVFTGSANSLQLLVLSGVIMGVLFASLTALTLRLLDPLQMNILQDSLFASFSYVDPILLRISMLVFAICFVFLWRMNAELDVLLLGESKATGLGVSYKQISRKIIVLVAMLVSVSTALVGPVSFFGLLVVHLAYRLAGSYRHRYLMPFAALLGVFTLVLGEFLLQHIFSFRTRLSIIIEFIGGVFFLALILRQGKA